MPAYRIGPLHLWSARRFPELQSIAAVPDGEAAWSVRWVTRLPRLGVRVEWFHQWTTPQGRTWLRLGRSGRRYVVRFGMFAAYVIDPDARAILVRPGPRVPAVTVRHLLLDQVLPMLLADAEHLVLHASAVSVNGRAVACVGESGAGKSTVAALLARAGHALVTDDCLVLGVGARGVHAMPMMTGLRLWPDTVGLVFGEGAQPGVSVAHYSSKRRVPPSPGSVPPRFEAAPLGAIFVLSGERSAVRRIRCRRLRGREAFLALVRCTFHLDVARHRTARVALDGVARVVEHVPVYAVECPVGLDQMPGVAALIAERSAAR